MEIDDYKVKINLDTVCLPSKNHEPTENTISRLKCKASVHEVTIGELAQAIKQGRAWTPGVMLGAKAKDWREQQVFAWDVDNDVPVSLLPHLKQAQVIETIRSIGIHPAIIYESYSSRPEHEKFRIIAISEKVITDIKEREHIIAAVMALFPTAWTIRTNKDGKKTNVLKSQIDMSCINADRFFYGTASDKKMVMFDEWTFFDPVAVAARYIDGWKLNNAVNEKLVKPKNDGMSATGTSMIRSTKTISGYTIKDTELWEKISSFNLLQYITDSYTCDVKDYAGEKRVDPCPLCGGKDRFSVDPSRNVYKCFGDSCGGEGGNIITFLASAENLDKAGAMAMFKYEFLGIDQEAELNEYKQKAAGANSGNLHIANSSVSQLETQWKAPTPFTDVTLPSFPVECLPPVLCNHAMAVSESTQTPVDMSAVRKLSVVSTCIQSKFRSSGKPDHEEPLNIFTATILPPAERKSAVDSRDTAPLHEKEQLTNENNRAAIARSKIERKMLEKAVDVLIAQAAKDPLKESDLFAKQDELTNYVDIKPLRLFCDDCTPEALISLMAENGGKMAVISSEGGIFEILNGRYSNGTNIDAFLKAHSGDPIRVDRKGRDPEYIGSPCLTVGLSIQPQVLGEIMGNASFGGRGLLARFLYCIPASKVGQRKYETVPIPPEVTAAYKELVFDLLDIPQPQSPHILQLSPEAYSLSVQFANELEPRLIDDLHGIAAWAGKLHGAVLRIAGILHVCEQLVFAADTPVSGETMAAAIKIGDYFTKHAKHAFSLMGFDETEREARYVLSKIEKNRIERFTKSEIMKLCRKYKAIDELTNPLQALVEHGYIKITDTTNTANRVKVVTYSVNPLHLKTLI